MTCIPHPSPRRDGFGLNRLLAALRRKVNGAAIVAAAALLLLTTTLAVAGAPGHLAPLPGAHGDAAIIQAADTADTRQQNVPALRQQYIDEVHMLAGKAETMRLAGSSQEEIARALHADRRALGVKYKNLTEPSLLASIYARNEKKYGDKLGPSVEWLREQGKSWEDIITSSSRTGGQDLNFNAKPGETKPGATPQSGKP